MQRYELTTDQDFYNTMADYTQMMESYPFESSVFRLTIPSCTGTVSNLRLLEGFAITVFDIAIHRPVSFSSHFAMPRIIELGFVTSGVIEMAMPGKRREFDSMAGQNYLAVVEGDVNVNTVAPAGQRIQLIEIRFTPEMLDECCHQIGQSLPKALEKPCLGDSTAPYKCASVLTSEMQSLVQQIFAHSDDSDANHLFLEGKCLDLMRCYLSFANDKMPTNSPCLSPRDIERVREARHILTQRMADPPSLIELAHLVNLNDFKLKLGFRQAFGTTAYGYLKEIRLQQAQMLLRDHNKSVTETAFTVGYRNIGDFGIAFKRRFGLSPKYAHQLKNP